jgi:hypothetical protein
MTNQNTETEKKIRKEFKRLVIEKIHRLPYEEVVCECYMCRVNGRFGKGKINKPYPKCPCCLGLGVSEKDKLPITIGRVMSALGENYLYDTKFGISEKNITKDWLLNPIFICHWKLLKDDKSEATDEDQESETIKKLLTLLR